MLEEISSISSQLPAETPLRAAPQKLIRVLGTSGLQSEGFLKDPMNVCYIHMYAHIYIYSDCLLIKHIMELILIHYIPITDSGGRNFSTDQPNP